MVIHGTVVDGTVEPLNKGHVGTSNFVPCREVVRSSEVQTILENEHMGL